MVSIDPKLWGPSGWRLLHDVSFYISESSDEKIIEKSRKFFGTLRYVLPCTACQYSYDIHLLHLRFPSKKTAVPRWVFDLHNRVNRSLSTPAVEWGPWAEKYPSEMAQHRLKDAWPFIQSVVEAKGTYPELRTFFKYLWEFLYKLDAYHSDKEVLKGLAEDRTERSKREFRDWITSIGKKIHSASYDVARCNTACH